MELRDQQEEKAVAYSPGFIKQTAAVAAMSSFGVVGMSYKSLLDEMLGALKIHDSGKGVKITSLGNGVIIIDLYVIMEFGTRLVAVAESLIDLVKYSVEKQAPVKVARVNVHVQYVRV